MPIKVPTNSLYRIHSLNVALSGKEYYLSMNYGKSQACVLCVSRSRLIGAQDLDLTEADLEMLFSGGKVECGDFVLQGISGQQLTALSQYRNNALLKPPAYVQAWSMAVIQNERCLFIPEDPATQMYLVPVHYQVLFGNGCLTVSMDQCEGYNDGDLLYQVEDRLPIPIPASWINQPIPLRFPPDKVRVVPAASVANNYIVKK